jgi:hypothetical protein
MQMTNTSGSNIAEYDEGIEMSVYDGLPKTFRHALANSAFKWGAIEMDKYRKAHRLSHHHASAFIKDQEDKMIRSQAYDMWGHDYLKIVYPKIEVNRFDW